MPCFRDLTGQKFGRLSVIGFAGMKNHKSQWVCKCDCGNEVTVSIQGLGKDTRSCGCLHKELTSKLRKTHGQTNTRLHSIWANMVQRCHNPRNTKYKYYGKQGIKVCEEWKTSFESFALWASQNGYNDNLTIDRVDYSGDYTPDNCRWADMKTQNNNKRNNHYLTFNGKTQTISMWAAETGLSFSLISGRINKLNWSVEKALTTPKKE